MKPKIRYRKRIEQERCDQLNRFLSNNKKSRSCLNENTEKGKSGWYYLQSQRSE